MSRDLPVARPAAVDWTPATVVAARSEGRGTRTLVLDAPGLAPALAGQHIDIRVTAEDGYTAQRSYSLASAAHAAPVEVTVDRLPDGEVSPYLVDGIEVGDRVEVRGPVGGWFVWRPTQEEPVTLVAGGSGLVPVMSIIRTRRHSSSDTPFRLIVSARSPERDLYRTELDELEATEPWLDIHRFYSRDAPAGDRRGARRIDAAELAAVAFPPEDRPSAYLCGPTAFVEVVATAMAAMRYEATRVRAERFGASG